jgi:hypothetical protein
MNITKMSLVAALLIGSSAFAIDNIKTSGDAKLYYSTDDAKHGDIDSLFDKATSAGQAAVSLSLSADLTKGVSAGTKLTTLSTLGLQGQLVNNVWEGTSGLNDSFITNEFWLAGTVGKTTGKIGRMELDTPLAFSEKWSIVSNSFEAAVIINQDIPGTTLVGAFVGGSNGSHNLNGNGGGKGLAGVIDATKETVYVPLRDKVEKKELEFEVESVVEHGTTFKQFFKGAYAAAVVNNSFKPLTVQAWYYHATSITTAYWLQADLNMEGILVGAQYTGIGEIHGMKGNKLTKSGNALAVMLGYEMKDMVTAKVAYSQIGDEANAGFNLSGTKQSKLYTDTWWNYGQVTQKDTTSINLTVESPVNGIVDLGLYVTMVDHGDKNKAGNLMETTVTAGKTFGPLDATLAVIYADEDAIDTTGGATAKDPDAVTMVQAYLTYNF